MDDISQNVNVVTPEGEVASLPQNQLQDALNSGFTQASPEDLRSYDLQQKYGNQKLKTAAEGAAQSATFGLSTGIEKLLGTKPEDILGREEANPVSHGVGQVAGFLVPGSPEARGLETLGKGASRALGLGAKTAEELAAGARQVGALNKIGSSAVKGAVETAALTGGDEISKMLANDPDQSIQTAATNIGLSGILGGVTGGGLGSISPLWEATAGPKTSQIFEAISRKANGFDGVLPDVVEDELLRSGIDMPSEVKGLFSDNPYIKQQAQILRESRDLSGTKYQEALNNFRKSISEEAGKSFGLRTEDISKLSSVSERELGEMALEDISKKYKSIEDQNLLSQQNIEGENYISAKKIEDQNLNIRRSLNNDILNKLGRSTSDVENLANLSNYDLGAKLKKTILDEMAPVAESVENKYNELNGTIKDTALPESTDTYGFMKKPINDQISKDLQEMAIDKKFVESPDSKQMGLIKGFIDEAKNYKTLESLKQAQTRLSSKTFADPEMRGVGGFIKNILRKAEDDATNTILGPLGKELIDLHAGARGSYRDLSNLLETVDDKLKVGKWAGPKTFVSALKQMQPEDVLKKLADKNDAELLGLLKNQFPKTGQLLKDYHIDSLLKNMAGKGSEGLLEQGVLKKALEKMTPEMKNFLFPAGNVPDIESLEKNYLSKLIDNPELNKINTKSKDIKNQFVEKSAKLNPEALWDKLTNSSADTLVSLKNEFPELAQMVKAYKVNELLREASEKATDGEILNTKHLFKKIGALSDDMKNFLIDEQGQQKLSAIKSILDKLPDRPNPSGTAGVLAKLIGHIPSSLGGLLSWASGHGAAFSLFSAIAPGAFGESKSALRLGLLKFLGSGQHVSASGFKGMVEYIDHMIKGENLIGSSVKNLFKGASLVIPEKLVPDQSKRDRLDKKIESLKTNPEHLLNVGGTTTAYLPEHGNSIGQTAGAAVSYLQSVKPQGIKKAPLDVEPSIPKAETAQYNRTLDIAEQPLVILQHIKNGSLTVRDMVDLHSMYPALYNKLNSQISDQLSNAVHKGTEIPYKTKLSLSLFMGQPLDSTMTPSAIQNSQLAMTHAAVQQGLKEQKQKGSLQKLDKLAGADQTPQQSREARHLKS